MGIRKFDLEDRLIDFALRISEVVEAIPNSRLGNQICSQLIRCGTSPALNCGEAQSAESPNDFIHKLKVILKELRETRICLKIIQRKGLIKPERIEDIIEENNQLIAIFLTSIKTAKNKALR
ncbi:MAG: four helix bundle protein [Bacteroidales bacterium]|nr:four helix bundle protein [Bacteroidales bacterium]